MTGVKTVRMRLADWAAVQLIWTRVKLGDVHNTTSDIARERMLLARRGRLERAIRIRDVPEFAPERTT